MIRTVRHMTLWAALAISLVASIHSAGVIYDIHQDNDLIRQLTSGKDVAVNKVIGGAPELRLAGLFISSKNTATMKRYQPSA